jgi:hypothetical protein
MLIDRPDAPVMAALVVAALVTLVLAMVAS